MTTDEYLKFPYCEITHCDQRSDEWFQARKGLLTASQFGDWLTKSGKVADKARLTAAAKCLAEYSGYPDPAPKETDDMRRGVEMEPHARVAFEAETGYRVTEVGFAKSIYGWFGCSPDGLVLATGEGLEIKCPRPSKLIEYIANGELPDQYKAQVHGSMAVTGAPAWHFYAWYPGFPSFHVRVEWEEYTSAMLEGLKQYSAYFETLAEKINSITQA